MTYIHAILEIRKVTINFNEVLKIISRKPKYIKSKMKKKVKTNKRVSQGSIRQNSQKDKKRLNETKKPGYLSFFSLKILILHYIYTWTACTFALDTESEA